MYVLFQCKFSSLSLDPVNESAVKNREFYKFYNRENKEKWLTPEQWNYKEELKNDKLYKNGTFALACNSKSKLVSISCS